MCMCMCLCIYVRGRTRCVLMCVIGCAGDGLAQIRPDAHVPECKQQVLGQVLVRHLPRTHPSMHTHSKREEERGPVREGLREGGRHYHILPLYADTDTDTNTTTLHGFHTHTHTLPWEAAGIHSPSSRSEVALMPQTRGVIAYGEPICIT